jgi:5-methyltetrahydropteroyltriglutamate--homocysteine methyltransferase
VVTEPINVTRPGLLAEEARFLIGATDRATKVCVPGPYILGVRFWDPELSVKAYPTRESFVEAMVPVLRAEVLALRDAGVSVIQIDEPQLCTLVDPDQEPYYGSREYDIGLAASKVNGVVGDLDGVRTALHLCRLNSIDRSWVFEGGYGPIMPALSTIDVDQFVMEFSIPVTGNVSVLKGLPEDKLIGLGCIDVRGEAIDTSEQVVERVEEAMQYVDWQRLSLNPDCGFAPDWRHIVPLDDCYGKLSAEATAAEMLRQKYA